MKLDGVMSRKLSTYLFDVNWTVLFPDNTVLVRVSLTLATTSNCWYVNCDHASSVLAGISVSSSSMRRVMSAEPFLSYVDKSSEQ